MTSHISQPNRQSYSIKLQSRNQAFCSYYETDQDDAIIIFYCFLG